MLRWCILGVIEELEERDTFLVDHATAKRALLHTEVSARRDILDGTDLEDLERLERAHVEVQAVLPVCLVSPLKTSDR